MIPISTNKVSFGKNDQFFVQPYHEFTRLKINNLKEFVKINHAFILAGIISEYLQIFAERNKINSRTNTKNAVAELLSSYVRKPNRTCWKAQI